MKFFELRNRLAISHVPSTKDIEAEYHRDKMRNPHNDYHKPPLRSQIQIVSDLKFLFADGVLIQQFGKTYLSWLQQYTDTDKNTGVAKMRDLPIEYQ